MLVRLFSVLVRRDSVGEEGIMFGRCWSRLDRLDWRLRGGGGGGGIALPVLSFETTRWVLRPDDAEEVGFRLGAGDEGSMSDSMVLLREDEGPGADAVVRTEVDL